MVMLSINKDDSISLDGVLAELSHKKKETGNFVKNVLCIYTIYIPNNTKTP